MSSFGIGIGIAALAIAMAIWGMFDTWLKAKDRRATSRSDIDGQRAAELMAAENEQLKGQVGRLEERIAVLERIATDPAARTAREIEALRTGDQ